MDFTAAEIAKRLGGEVQGDSGIRLKGLAPSEHAQAGDLTFAENADHFSRAERSNASAILVDGEFSSDVKTLIRVPNSRIAFARVLPLFFPEPVFAAGIHATAIVAKSAQVDASVHVGPYCAIGEEVRIGPRSVLQGGSFIGAGSRLGEEVNIFPNVTIYPRTEIGNRVRIHSGTVVGSDGFGYVLDGGAHRKVLQIGNVVVGDDVEIGANVTIDRGALGPTTIGRGSKIDNLVQIAHNVMIGEHCLVVSQAGISGSTKLGNYVVLAGQVGLAGHLKIGDRVVIAAQSGVMHNIPEGEKWFGYPAQPDRQTKRQIIALQQLPELLRRIKELEKRLPAAAKERPSKK